MQTKQQILMTIKSQIKEVIPESEVILFGSRVNNTDHEESDWDILVITNNNTDRTNVKQTIHDKIFPLSVAIGSFINVLLLTNRDWQKNPSYYSLRQSVAQNHLVL